MHPGQRLASLLSLLEPVLDIVATPVDEPEPPAWCRERGWVDFLLGLSDRELGSWELHGLASELLEASPAPRGFRELFREARTLAQLPRIPTPPLELPPSALRGVPARKREQLGTLLGALEPRVERARRVVDVGAGSGHLSRLSAELFRRTALALDRDGGRLQRGDERSRERARQVGALDVHFVEVDLSRHELVLRPTDLAVGLHACGELADRLVLAAAAARCDVALVSCCLQKISAPARSALSQRAGSFSLAKSTLGLTNLTFRAQGVEATLSDNLRARAARLALRRLLRARGLELRAGEEMRGVNRRRAQAGFAELAAHALSLRDLPPPTAAELRLHGESAAIDSAIIRRLSLPRHLLARVVELAVISDRAASLEEAGFRAELWELFPPRVSPRNTLLLATPS